MNGRLAYLLLVASLPLLACGGDDHGHDHSGEPAAADDPSRPAAVLPLPGSDDSLPQGHPPLGGGAPELPPVEGVGGMEWDAPEGWVAETPANTMRQAQYRIPGPGGDAECVVFYFGAGQGGDPMANAVRWAGQFSQPDGSPSTDAMQTDSFTVGNIEVLTVSVTGTYSGGMTMGTAPAEPQPGSMLLGAVAQGPDAPWFFKLTGPEETVKSHRDAFDGMMRSLRTSG